MFPGVDLRLTLISFGVSLSNEREESSAVCCLSVDLSIL